MVISSDAVSGKEKAANSVPLSAGGHMSPHVITSAGSDPNAAIPEPCGGVLLLIGGALLALRRRRMSP